MNERFDYRFFKVRSNLLGSKLTVSDRHGSEIFYVPIKDLRDSSEVEIFVDKRSKNSVLRIEPVFPEIKGWFKKIRGALSNPLHHNVVDSEADEKVGALRRETKTHVPQDEKWIFLDAEDREIGHLEPLSSGFLGGKFEHAGYIGDEQVCAMKSRNTIAGREVNVDFYKDEHCALDRRLSLSLAVKIAVDIVNVVGND
jgi:hypothetical protein